MVLGTSPESAKSVLTIALCRALANAGRKVCPFKAISVSDPEPGAREGNRGEALRRQCDAARMRFEEDMNPVAVVAISEGAGELYLGGEIVSSVRLLNRDAVLMSKLSVDLRARVLLHTREAYESLVRRFDFVVIEGAGSPVDLPAEHDVPNIMVARLFGGPIVLSCKFSRGGGAAALVGSVYCLPEDVRSLLVGFVFSDVQDEDEVMHSVRLVERHLSVPYLGAIPRIPLWSSGVDSYELLASTICHSLDLSALNLPL
jgi:adenosylcobyric acid synthase